MPTETVYGIACDPKNKKAMNTLQNAKGRDPNKPISRLASSLDQVKSMCTYWNSGLNALCYKYWPGPLTLVLDTNEGWIGFRVPNHSVPISICKKFGGLLALSSANISGKSDPKTAEDASIIPSDLIIDSGPSSDQAIPSSVVKIGKNIFNGLREGAVSFENVKKCFNTGMNI